MLGRHEQRNEEQPRDWDVSSAAQRSLNVRIPAVGRLGGRNGPIEADERTPRAEGPPACVGAAAALSTPLYGIERPLFLAVIGRVFIDFARF